MQHHRFTNHDDGNDPDGYTMGGPGLQRPFRWFTIDLYYLHRFDPDTPIEEGRNVAMLASHLGLWSLNACRIVYTIDEPHRFGFTYGTLADHVEAGEERFTVERDDQTGEIFYDLYSFSRPRQILAILGYPYARYLQTQFVADSKKAMARAVKV